MYCLCPTISSDSSIFSSLQGHSPLARPHDKYHTVMKNCVRGWDPQLDKMTRHAS